MLGIGHGGCVAKRPDVVVTTDLQVLVDDDPAHGIEFEPELGRDRLRRDAGGPHQCACRHVLAG